MVSRTLLIMRHADAEPGRPGTPDAQRKLTAQGHERAAAQAAVLGDHPVEVVLCSAATRAVQTLSHLPTADATVIVEPGLYEAGPTEVLLRLAEVGAEVRSVLVVGHMPTVAMVTRVLLTDLDDAVAADTPGAARLHASGGFGPGDLVVMQSDRAWADLQPGSARLLRYVT